MRGASVEGRVTSGGSEQIRFQVSGFSERRRLMSNKFVCLALSALLLALCVPAGAQQPGNMPQLGFLSGNSASTISARVGAFRQGLREVGYAEGKNIAIEYRYADGKLDRLNDLAAELVTRKVSVIVTHGDSAIGALNRATKTIPIVVGVTGDLVETGYAASLAHPGGNITGFVDTSPDLSGKRLEVLKETLPKALRIAVLWNSGNRVKLLDFKESEKAANALGLTLQSVEVKKAADFDSRLTASLAQRPDALVVLVDSLTTANAKAVIEFAAKNKLPTMYGTSEVIDGGGLMSYAANIPDLFRRAAAYVDKILKGASAADLPIQQPNKFELVINLKAAKQIGLTIPPNVLARADKVIK